MDPILIGAGLLALYKGKRVAQKVSRRNAEIAGEIENLNLLKKDVENVKKLLENKQIKPDSVVSYLSHIEKDLPVKAKRKFLLNPFSKKIEKPHAWLDLNINRLKNMITTKEGKIKSPFKEGLKEGIVWGVSAYGLGQIAKRIINSSENMNPYQVYYPDYNNMY